MNRATRGLLIAYDVVEKAIVIALLLVLMIVVLWATWTYCQELLGMLTVRIVSGVPMDLSTFGGFITRLRVLHDVFGGFMLILIGVELMKTVAMYLLSHEMHVEVVFTVAIIAVARHAIDLDLKHLAPMQLVGLGALLVSLAGGHYFFRKASAPISAGPAPSPGPRPRPGHGASRAPEACRADDASSGGPARS